MNTIRVRNVSRRPQDIQGGRVLAHREEADAPDCPHTRGLLDEGVLIRLDQPALRPARTTRGDES